MHSARLYVILTLLVLPIGCADNALEQTQRNGLDEDFGADHPHVEWVDTDERLVGVALKRVICEDIVENHAFDSVDQRDTFASVCTRKSFTITRALNSGLYQNVEGQALRLAMDIRVASRSNPADVEWPCRAVRRWDAGAFAFTWTATCEFDSLSQEAIDDRIAALADETPEYPEDARIFLREQGHLDVNIEDVPEDLVGFIRENYLEDEDPTIRGRLSSHATAIRDGETVIGYVMFLSYTSDFSDGDGVIVFINLNQIVVAENYWVP